MKKSILLALLLVAGSVRAQEISVTQTLSEVLKDLMQLAKSAVSIPGAVGDIRTAALNIKETAPCLKSMSGECLTRCTNRQICAASALNDAARILRPVLKVLLGTIEMKAADGKTTQSYVPGVLGTFLVILDKMIKLVSDKLKGQVSVGPYARQISEKLGVLQAKFATLVGALTLSVDTLQALSVQLAPNAGLPVGPGKITLPPVQLAGA